MHRPFARGLAATLLCSAFAAQATVFTFNTDPWAGTTVRNAPGRQIVGGESFINFFSATDTFVFDPAVYGVQGPLSFANGTAQSLGTTSANVIVLDSTDDDNNPLTPFGAGNAANLIASHMATSGPGFFIYFNQSLDLARLAYSSDLSSTSSDIRILARLINLNGQRGRDALPLLRATDFEFVDHSGASVPEPASALLALSAIGLCAVASRRKAASAASKSLHITQA
jgi:hypothetical protein